MLQVQYILHLCLVLLENIKAIYLVLLTLQDIHILVKLKILLKYKTYMQNMRKHESNAPAKNKRSNIRNIFPWS